MAKLELRRGAKVRYLPAASDVWREGELVKRSPTDEEWLVKNRFGKFWIHVTRLEPAEDEPPTH